MKNFEDTLKKISRIQTLKLMKAAISLSVLLSFVISCASISTPASDLQIEAAHSYYVDANLGSDVNPGTKDLPWKTIQKAADVVSAGEIVQVLTGYYPERVQVTKSGMDGSQITFIAAGNVVMKGFTIKADFITIRGFEITDTSDLYEDGVGVFVQGKHCVIEDNYIHDTVRGGVLLFVASGDDYSNTSNCIVRRNRLYHNSQKGIDVRGEDHLIESNEIWRTIQYHPRWISPPESVDADGIRFFGSGHIFRKNYIHDISYSDPENIDPHIDCFQTWDGPDFEAGHDVVFEQNICLNLENDGGEETGKGFMLENASNILIRNNIIRGYFGVFAINSSDLKIVNNTFAYDLSITGVDDYPSGIQQVNTANSNIINNIFYDFNGLNINWLPLDSVYSPRIENNLFFRSDNQPLLDVPYPGNLWNIDPAFISPAQNDFRLGNNSPGIDMGIVLEYVRDDLVDVIRPQGRNYDIGAYEMKMP